MATNELSPRIITLTSDFGLADWFAGVMKGVIARLAPQAGIIDVTHLVPAFNVPACACILQAAYGAFPQGSVHVAIVDPTVGTKRRPLLIEAGGHFFIGPDNGLFSLVLDEHEKARAWTLDKSRFRLDNPHGQTFDGRDVFAAAAGHLASSVKAQEMGTEIDTGTLVRLEGLHAEQDGNRICGKVIYKDRFGNLITSITARDIGSTNRRGLIVNAGALNNLPLLSTYADIAPGACAAIINSSGRLELCSFCAPAPRDADGRVEVIRSSDPQSS